MAFYPAHLGYPPFHRRILVFRDFDAQLHEIVGENHVSCSLAARGTEWNGQKWFKRAIKGRKKIVDILVQVYPVSHFCSFDPSEWKIGALHWNALENSGWGYLGAVCPKLMVKSWIFDFLLLVRIGRKTCFIRIFSPIFVLDSPYLISIPSSILVSCLVSEFWIRFFFSNFHQAS